VSGIVRDRVKDNPYSSPATLAAQPAVPPNAKRTRPIGVWPLAILHLLGGTVLLGLVGFMLADFDNTDAGLVVGGIPTVPFFIAAILFAMLVFASGIGLWLGAKWAWWCGAFFYVWTVVSSLVGLLFYCGAQFFDVPYNTNKDAIDFVGRSVVHGLVYLYFLKGSVLSFFGLQAISRIRASMILAGISLVVFAAITAFSFFRAIG
jgi:hypothetical protein